MDRDSIHWRRRWFYALWATLLGVASGAYVLWAIPGQRGTAHLVVTARLESMDGATAAMGTFATGELPQAWRPMAEKEGRFVGDLSVPLAYRRWTGSTHHGQCHEGVVIRFQKGSEVRYCLIDLRSDINTGLFAPGRRMILEYGGLGWERMAKDIPPLPRLP